MDVFEAITQRRSIRSHATEEEIETLLAVCALDLGACWVGLIDKELIKQTLSLPKGIRPAAIIPVRHTKTKTKPTPRKLPDEVVYRGHFEIK